MKLNKQTIIIMVVLIVVVVVAIFAFLVFPQFAKLGELELEITAAEMDRASAQTLLARRQNAKANSAQTESKLMRLANELPEAPQLPSVIIELQDIMNSQGLEFSSLSPGRPTDTEEGYSAVPIQLRFDGRWSDMVALLQNFPRMNRQVRVVSFSVTRMAPVEESNEETPVVEVEPEERVSVSMAIEVYTMAQTEATGGTAAPAAPAQ